MSELDLEHITSRIGDHINRILRENLYEMNLSESELKRLSRQKEELRRNLFLSGTGDLLAKRYVIQFLSECLLKIYNFNEESISNTFYFNRNSDSVSEYLFDRLLYLYKKDYDQFALEEMIEENGFFENGFELTHEEIEEAYVIRGRHLEFNEKLELLSWKVYSAYKGLGIIDEIRDMNIDGVSGGVSGMDKNLDSVWIFYRGRSVHMNFLRFKSHAELERICRNICRFEQPGELSKTRGYIVHEMADGSRIVVARPPFSESWLFFVRKLDQGTRQGLDELYHQKGAHLATNLIKWLMRGCQVVGITGMQGCGKTTLLMAMAEFIPQEYTIRVLELAFELHLRRWYPNRNIVTFRETPSVSGMEGLEVQKKTDGAVSIIGEVASARVAAWMIESGQTGSLFTVFTHHAKTSEALVYSLRNALISAGSFNSENIATSQVVSVVNFDIHLHMDRTGRRFIDRITHIRPADNTNGFVTVDLVSYDEKKDCYVQLGVLPESTKKQMAKWMLPSEREAFYASGY